ncbi:alpha-2-macroglobulin-like protein 1 [Protopterus annectens]|uniref:alpha-2-macroglobulin-like protein 1 n=1 Tax=Protopterus annectens TaxID=7888 RepID=UPI001CFAFB43|nr:alpha-2-macroglobulin-like protein 1 [Protopterus annectens]
MMWHRVLISCILLQTVIQSDQQPQFLVIFPAQLQSLTTAKVCAHVFNIDRSFILTITLQTNVNNQTLFLDTIVGSASSQAPSYYKCASFQVPLIPQVVNQDGSAAIMMVRARDRERNVMFEQAKQVFVLRAASGTFVQTDKPVYLRGDKVRCRIVSLDSKLIPQNDEYPLIELKDPDGNRIGQWLNLRPQQGIAEISFQLTSEAMLGDYIFQLTKEKGENIYQIFSVDTHVLPKFDVSVFAPKVVTLSESQFQVSFCGRYIYNRPVKGTLKATICRLFYLRISSNIVDTVCQEYSGQTNITGCYTTVILTEDFLFGFSNYQSYFNIQASLEEDGTGINVTHSEYVPISEVLVKIEFQNAEKYYRTDTPFTGKLVMQRSDGTRVSFQPVYLSLVSNSSDVRRYITDADGTASFSLDTTSWTGPKELRASYFANSTISEKYEGARLDLQQFYSNTQSYLTIQQPDPELKCGETANIRVDYAFTQNELRGTLSQSISYLVITRGEIIVNGQYNIPPGRLSSQYVARGSFNITLPISPAVAPTARLLAYAVLPAGAVTAQRVDLKVSKCFNNKVSLQFSNPEVLPGSNVSLSIQAAPNSLCALRAIDKSIFLLKPEMEITADFVYSILKPQEFSGYPLQVDEFFYNPCYPFSDIYDTFYIFKIAGMKVITNCEMKKPLRCSSRSILGGSRLHLPVSEWSSALFVPPPYVVKSQTRTDFSEVWIWQLESIGNQGKNITLPIPDTVTEWKASMFCTASTGFGLADAVSVVTFKPFFLEPLLPYSVIRGESFELKAKVFNYLQDCIMVQIRLLASASYTSVSNPNHQYTTCLCANKEKTVSWTVTPITLGVINITVRAQAVLSSRLCGSQIPNVLREYDVDTVVKTLLVLPEGLPVALSKTSMICVNNTSVKEEADFQLPPNVINGSARGEIIVIGDIMGTAMQNIEMLLQVPYGCGEQNLVSFAVDVSVLRYLKATNRLTSQAKQQWSLFLQKGYQKQLNFKNSDCSFSGFGPKDTEEGSLWLTSFVASQFAKASEFTFIDGNVIDCAVQWILQKQLENGCFERTGRIFQPSLKTAVNDDISLSAYVCYSLQELPNRTAQIVSIWQLS